MADEFDDGLEQSFDDDGDMNAAEESVEDDYGDFDQDENDFDDLDDGGDVADASAVNDVDGDGDDTGAGDDSGIPDDDEGDGDTHAPTTVAIGDADDDADGGTADVGALATLIDMDATESGEEEDTHLMSHASPQMQCPQPSGVTDMDIDDDDKDDGHAGHDGSAEEMDEAGDDVERIFEDAMRAFPIPTTSKKRRLTEYLGREERQQKLARWYERCMTSKQIHNDAKMPTDAVKGTYTHLLGDTVQEVEGLVRTVLKAFLATYGYAHMHVESFNKFYNQGMADIINERGPICVDSREYPRRQVIEFSNPKWGMPCAKEKDGTYRQIGPEECLQRGLTWVSPILVDITHHTVETESPPGLTPLNNQGLSNVPIPLSLPPNELAKLSTAERLAVYGKVIETRVYRETLLGYIPMMRGSDGDPTRFRSPAQNKECVSYAKGTFCITGMPKVVIPQENPRINYCRVTFIRKQDDRYSIQFEARTLHESRLRSSSTIQGKLLKGANPSLFVKMPFIENYLIPMTDVYKLLGFTSSEEILASIVGAGGGAQSLAFMNLAKSLIQPNPHTHGMNIAQMLNHIGLKGTKETTPEKRARYVKHIFASEFFPQMGLKRGLDTLKKRAVAFSYCVRKLMYVKLGMQEEDDIDHDMDKAWETVGGLNSILLRQLFTACIRSLTASVHQDIDKGKYVNVVDSLVTKRITGGFKYFYTTGNFGISRGGATQKGVCQVLTNFNMWSILNHLRRVNKPVCREGRATQPRMLYASSWGRKCPVATPEGEACGFVLSAALLAHVRVGYKSKWIKPLLLKMGVIPLLDDTGNVNQQPDGSAVVLVNNGAIFGYAVDPAGLCKSLVHMRRSLHIFFDTTIAHMTHGRESEIYIGTEPGCVMRPLFVCENLHKIREWRAQSGTDLKRFWMGCLQRGIIEFVSAMEESTCFIAMFPDDVTQHHTHLEIDPNAQFSYEAYTLSRSDMNQAPRNVYASQMERWKYSSFPCINYIESMATSQHILHNAQVPLVSTHVKDLITEEQCADVQNLTVAIVTDECIEDSIIINRRAVDFGVGRATMLRTYRDQEKITGADLETFMPPDKARTKGMQDGNYDKTDADGIMGPGTRVCHKDIICSKVQHSNQAHVKKPPGATTTKAGSATTGAGAGSIEQQEFTKMMDKSLVSRNREDGVIDRVTMSVTEEGAKQTRVRVRYPRKPEPGDKYAIKDSAQKGVITRVRAPEDMMFNPETGISPDIYFGLSGVISRMTMSFITNAVLGKAACLEGCLVDGTNYRSLSWHDVAAVLKQGGFTDDGKECMIDGETGQVIEVRIFTGIIPYMRMKQMVIDKEHARPRGPKSSITRQPKEGRRQHGGIRFGEMEKDNLIDHATPAILDDRMNAQSDAHFFFMHRRCGLLVDPPKSKINKLHKTLGMMRASLDHGNSNGQQAAAASVAAPSSAASSAASASTARDPNKPWCRTCKTSDDIHVIRIPYALKLLFQELRASHIQPRILVEADDSIEVVYEHSAQSATPKFSNQQLMDLCNRKLHKGMIYPTHAEQQAQQQAQQQANQEDKPSIEKSQAATPSKRKRKIKTDLSSDDVVVKRSKPSQ
jgi:DNA-directed RNA polymerase II subunit RPB2